LRGRPCCLGAPVLTPTISAASHKVSFLAMAFNNTSCSFIIRSISVAEYVRPESTFQALVSAAGFQSGQIMR
jgi:hypothetical protein